MKKTISVIIAVLMLCTSAFASDVLWENRVDTTITRGVVHTKIEKFMQNGWQRMDVLKIDLNDPNVDLAAIFDPRGVSYRGNVLSISEAAGAVAAVNADFFNLNNPAGRTTPLGLTVEDGEIVSSPSHEPWMAALAQREDKSVVMDYFSIRIVATAPNSNQAEILHINKYHPLESLIMYTPKWGKETPGGQGSSELVAKDGVVLEVRRDMGPAKIPENGFVLAANPAINGFLVDNFKPGDPISIEYTITPNFGQLETAVGGGTLLVRDGQRASFTHNISGQHPRTAAGVDQSGKILYLVTVEGRQTNTPGMTQEALADFLISLGAYTAINFDGGGSTTMVARSGLSGRLEVVNRPSDGALRAVSTALGVKSVGEGGVYEGFHVKAASDNVFLGDGVEIWCMPYDTYFNPITLDEPVLSYSSDDGGRFEGAKYYPNKAGIRSVTVTLNGISRTVNIRAMEKPAQISIYPPSFSLAQNETKQLIIIGRDSDGYESILSPGIADWSVVYGSASVAGGSVTNQGSGAIAIRAEFGGLEAFAFANGGGAAKTYDFENSTATFQPYPSYVKGSVSTVTMPSQKGRAGELSFDFNPETDDIQAAHMYFAKSIPLGNAEKFGLWVYSDTPKPSCLKVQLDSPSGEVIRVTLANHIDWSGWRYIEAEVPAGARGGYFSKIYVVQNNPNETIAGRIVVDDIIISSPDKELEDSPFRDYLAKPVSAPTFYVLPPKHQPPKNMMNILTNLELEKRAGEAERVYSFGAYKAKTSMLLSFSMEETDGSLYLVLDNKSGGIRATNASQWQKLIEACDKNYKNAFIFLTSGIDSGFSDPAELRLFKETVSNLAKNGASTFVISHGEKAEVTALNGVRYMTVQTKPTITAANFMKDLNKAKYIRFTISGSEVNYEFVPIANWK